MYANYNKAVSLAVYIITESKANIKKKQSKKQQKSNIIWQHLVIKGRSPSDFLQTH